MPLGESTVVHHSKIGRLCRRWVNSVELDPLATFPLHPQQPTLCGHLKTAA
jgi:hypothetical protein